MRTTNKTIGQAILRVNGKARTSGRSLRYYYNEEAPKGQPKYWITVVDTNTGATIERGFEHAWEAEAAIDLLDLAIGF